MTLETGFRKMDLESIIFDAAQQCENQGDFSGAILNYRGLLDSFPDNAVAAHRLGRLLFSSGARCEGLEWLKKAASDQTDVADIQFDLGVALAQLHKYGEATSALSCAVELRPDHGEALFRLGLAFQQLKSTDRACDVYRRAIAVFRQSAATAPQDAKSLQALADSLCNLGILQRQSSLIGEAVAVYRRVIALDTTSAEAFCSLGTALTELQSLDAAVHAYLAAIAVRPNFTEAYRNLGIALTRVGRLERAGHAFQNALALTPESPVNHFNLAMHRLGEGDYRQGWAGYEYRWKLEPPPMPRRDFDQPMWDGEPLAGKTILLHAEQGLGDCIHFLRYVPMVARLGARIVLEVQRPLLRLVESSLSVETLLARGDRLPPFDVHCPLLSLPRIFDTTLTNIPASRGYLSSDPDLRTIWSARIPSSGRKRIGLVWAGSPTHNDDLARSVPFDRLSPLWGCDDIDWYSLQLGFQSKDVATAPAGRLVDLSAWLTDFAETSAALDNLDLLISVDTAAAHLAGALGRPCWLLLPFAADWRWLRDRDDSPWYSSIRLYRPRSENDWDYVLGNVVAELRRPF